MTKFTAAFTFLGVLSIGFAILSQTHNVAAQPVAAMQQKVASDETPQTKPAASADDEEPVTVLLKDLMLKKLASSNLILRGLVTDELTLVTKGADQLLTMSNHEKWRASTNMMYMQHSQEFRRSVEQLKSKAEKQSIDGAALAWMDVTMSCIQCHQWVRDMAIADLGPNNPAAELAQLKLAK